jgi:2'-5' RNA ligase
LCFPRFAGAPDFAFVSPNWFLALPVSCDLDLASQSPPPCVRLFAREDRHLTVAFLGAVSAERALAAFEAARPVLMEPLAVSFGAMKALGPRHRPSAFSALLDQGREDVERFIAQVRDLACETAGVRRDERPPLAHVTLARPRRAARDEERAAAVRWAEALRLPPVTVRLTELALYTWSEDRRQSLFRVERARGLDRAY